MSKYENYEYDQETCLREFFNNIKDILYYKGLFSEFGFNVYANDIYTEIKKLPILTKEIVKGNSNLFINTNYAGKTLLMHTGGTTGAGMEFPISVESENKQWAAIWRTRKQLGLSLDSWCGWFGGKTIIYNKNAKSPYWRINRPGRQIMFSAQHLNSNTVDDYYVKLLSSNLTWIHGYPSQISLLAYLIKNANLKPIETIKLISVSSESLLESQISLFNQIFPNAKVRQHYGLTEGVASMNQDLLGNWKIDEDFSYVELIPISEDSPNLCHIIGTGFSNEAYPFVRYDTGDLVNVTYVNGVPQICSIEGRQNEFISLPNNARINSATLSLIFKSIPNIDESQIYQSSLSYIEFRIVKGKDYALDDEKLLIKNIRERIDESIEIKIKYLDKIERTKSGKLRLVISEL